MSLYRGKHVSNVELSVETEKCPVSVAVGDVIDKESESMMRIGD